MMGCHLIILRFVFSFFLSDAKDRLYGRSFVTLYTNGQIACNLHHNMPQAYIIHEVFIIMRSNISLAPQERISLRSLGGRKLSVFSRCSHSLRPIPLQEFLQIIQQTLFFGYKLFGNLFCSGVCTFIFI